MLTCVQASPQTSARDMEVQVKAAFLYKFCAYVVWPAQTFERTDSPFVIAVVDAKVFADALEQVTSGRNVNGHPIEIRRWQKGHQLNGAQMVYVGESGLHVVGDVISSTKGASVLIVTDNTQGLVDGSMINFVVEDNKVRFDIAPQPAEQSNLKISARLLSVARKIVARGSS